VLEFSNFNTQLCILLKPRQESLAHGLFAMHQQGKKRLLDNKTGIRYLIPGNYSKKIKNAEQTNLIRRIFDSRNFSISQRSIYDPESSMLKAE
jgi:hypothetical protein